MRNSLKNVCKLLQQVTEDVPVETSFLSDLKRSIELSDKKNREKPSQSYKPSSLKCIRNMYYQVTGADEDETEGTYTSIGIVNSGSDIHLRIQQAISEMQENGIDCEWVDIAEYIKSRNLDYLEIVEKKGMETKLYHKKLNMRFMCDGLVRYRGKYYIIELKTEASFKFADRKGVAPTHYKQGTSYSLSLDIPNVIFVYISRDVLDMKAYMFTPTDEMKAELIGEIANCDDYVKKGILPPKPDDKPRSVCNYCNYRERCRISVGGRRIVKLGTGACLVFAVESPSVLPLIAFVQCCLCHCILIGDI